MFAGPIDLRSVSHYSDDEQPQRIRFILMEKILDAVTILILVLAGLLLLSSALGLVFDLGGTLAGDPVQSYAGLTLIGLSVISAMLNLLVLKHPLYEYWVIVIVGGIVGAVYAV